MTAPLWLASSWKSAVALLAGGAATQAVDHLWPGNAIALAGAALVTAIAVWLAPKNRPAAVSWDGTARVPLRARPSDPPASGPTA